MSEPKIKKIVIDLVLKNVITFYTDQDTADKLTKFGEVRKFYGNKYILKVDPRYNIQEVADYITNLE